MNPPILKSIHISYAASTNTLDSGHPFMITVDSCSCCVKFGPMLSPRKVVAFDSISGCLGASFIYLYSRS